MPRDSAGLEDSGFELHHVYAALSRARHGGVLSLIHISEPTRPY